MTYFIGFICELFSIMSKEVVIMTTEHLEWRYATKKFDNTKKINPHELDEILESLRMAPSSFGIEPWKFIVVENQEIKEKLRPHAWNQAQITDASHVVVLCSWKKIDGSDIEKFMQRIATTRGMEIADLKGYKEMLSGFVNAKSEEELKVWMDKQVYIALGMLLSECAQRKIDTCPIEGFSPKDFDEILDLEELGVKSVVVCAIGYRSKEDKYANLAKVRLDKSNVFVRK